MNNEEFAARVVELAARVDYPAPPVTWVDGTAKEDCIWMAPPGPVGPMLFVHHHVNEKMPDQVQEFLIAQAFVQASLGVHLQRPRVMRARSAVSLLIAFGVMLVATLSIHDLVTYLLVGIPLIYLSMLVSSVLVVGTWSRWFMRRSDRRLVDLLGPDHVWDALQWYSGNYPSPGLRWLLCGAPPNPPERLRWRRKSEPARSIGY